MKTNVKIGTLWMLVAFIVFTACKKEATKDDASQVQTSSTDNALAENASADMEAMSAEAASGKQAFVSYSSSSVVIEYDTLNGNKVFTIDFGPVNTLCNDGRYRRGKVIVSYNGTGYFDEGSVVSISTQDYFVNDHQVIGSKTVSNIGNYTHHIVANWEIVKPNSGGSVTWNSERTRVQVAGMNTKSFVGDDTYEISGTADGINCKGQSYSISTQTNLVKEMACKWIKSGILDVTVGNKSGSIDYGDGSCDDQATVYHNGESKVITLK